MIDTLPLVAMLLKSVCWQVGRAWAAGADTTATTPMPAINA